MKRLFIVLFCISFASLYAATQPSLGFLLKQPNSIAKDYYLYNLFEQNKLPSIEKKDIFRMSAKMKKVYEHFHPRTDYKEKYKACFKDDDVLKMSLMCKKIRLKSTYFAKNLSKKTRRILYHQLKNSDKDTARFLYELNLKHPMVYVTNHNDIKHFLFFFTDNDEYLTKSFLQKAITNPANKRFFINAIYDRTYPKLRYSLQRLNPKSLDASFAFLLGIDAISTNKLKRGYAFMSEAAAKYAFANDRDNALFWLYLLSKDKGILQKIAASKDLNIYSLYAREKLGLNEPKIIVPKPLRNTSGINMQDPFLWQSLRKSLNHTKRDLLALKADKYYYKDSLSVYVFIMNKLNNKHYFIIPDNEALQGLSPKQKAMILAIARQESTFIPTAISSSFALGTMQFMPFLAKYIAKEKNMQNFTPDELFDPKLSFLFAKYHLAYLSKHLDKPIFIAYAYNGGIGFTKRLLAKKHMFTKKRFEPFLSMDLIPYAESRIYGKKVLANYFIYLNLLHEKTKISQFFE